MAARRFLIGLGATIIGMMGCRDQVPSTQVSAEGPLPVFVSIAPQKYFVERVAGKHVQVSVLLPPGQSHHSYEPVPRQVVDLSKARLFFCTGIPFEEQVVKKIASAMGGLRIVNVTQGIALRHGEACSHEGEHHDHDHGHDQDVHTWMDPILVKTQAQTICRTLSEVDPAHATEYQQNLDAFEADLDQIDAEIRQALAPLKSREFFVYHPAFGYFADRYGLVQVSVEIGGKHPTSKQLIRLAERAKATNVRVIFVQPQFPVTSAQALVQAIDGAVVSIDPMAENYLENLRDVSQKIRQALSPGEQTPSQASP